MKTLQEHARDDCDAFILRVRWLKHEAETGKRLTSDRAAQILLTNHQSELGALEAMANEIKSYVLAALVTSDPAPIAARHDRKMAAANDDSLLGTHYP